MKKVSLYFLSIIAIGALVLNFSSCGSSEEPVVAPSDFTYPATSVQVGATATIQPSSTAKEATYIFANKAAVPDFITLDANTGDLMVGEESTTGEYKIDIRATNSAGTASGSATITIITPDAFNPVGKKFVVTYFMNQEPDFVLTALDSLDPSMPHVLTLPVGWPDQNTPPEQLPLYGVLTQIGNMLMEVPSDYVCDLADPTYNGDTTLFMVNDDLTLSTTCTMDDGTAAGDVQVGVSYISYANGEYMFTISFKFTDALPEIPYAIGNARIENFTDPMTGDTYMALQGTVEDFTIPTDYTSDETMQNPLTWGTPMVDVVYRVVE